jgi:periplasmic divalent cation tolerance protein
VTECVVITTTLTGREDAHRIAGALIDERLAACVQVAPVESHYRWQRDVQQVSELLLTIKTTTARASAVQARIVELHGYALPEILILPVIGGLEAYLAWIAEAVAPVPT